MKSSRLDEEHWTEILYGRFPELYLPILEERKEMGAKEATGIAKILEQAGLGKGKILDLACGIGRHSIPLARMGYDVVGFDISALFIERARARAAQEGLAESKVRFYQGDMRKAADELSLRGETGFDAILNLFSSIGSYGEEEDAVILRGLHDVSAERCLLMLETLNRDFLLKRFQPFSIRRISKSLRLLDLARFNVETSTLEDDWRFYTEMPDGSLRLELNVQISGRIYTLLELKKVAVGAGWDYAESHGSILTPGPVSPDSPSIVFVGKKA